MIKDSSKFKSQTLSYKQDTEFKSLDYLNKAGVLLLITGVWHWYEFYSYGAIFTDMIIYRHINYVNGNFCTFLSL